MKYRFKEDEIYQMLDFAKEYHLEPTKGPQRRTVGGSGGFGDELDRFLIKNLTEIGACRIIESYSDNKVLSPDLKIYTNRTVAEKKDADITNVYDKNKMEDREPNFKIEIKKTSAKDHWFHAREEQIHDDLKNNVRGYMVHVSLEFNDDKNKKQRDITGSVLKKIIKSNRFHLNEFSDIEDLEANIEFAYSYSDLKEHGFYFPSGLIMPRSDFREMRHGPFRSNGEPSSQYEHVSDFNGKEILKMKTEKNTIGDHDISLFNRWVVEGNFSIYKKNNGNEFIYAKEETIMENKNLGRYLLEKNKTYKFHLINSLPRRSGEPLKGNDEYSFSRQKLKNLQNDKDDFSVESVCKEIANGI